MAAKIVQFGANKPLRISLPDCYWDVLFAMTQMAGETPEEYCKEAIEAAITMDLDNPEEFGKLLCDGWRETLEGKK